jgi:hypothetical protein
MANSSALIFSLTVLLASFSLPASACLGPSEEDYVLLRELPNDAKTQPVVAKVRVLSRTNNSAKVRVVEAIKGVQIKQHFTVYTSGSSCGWLDAESRFSGGQPSKPRSPTFFIAGNWRSAATEQKEFIGSWKKGQRVN